MTYSLLELNQMSQAEFLEVVGPVFEATPTIARQAWNNRPFADVADLYQKMVAVVTTLSSADQLALIRAHPDLGSKAKMAAASVQEQAGAGLNSLSPEEYDRFQFLNQTYKETFGFPFIIAVKNHTKSSILEAFERRLQNSIDAERQQALAEITQIAQFRLQSLIRE